jgi:predicted nucleotidyltransferase
MGSLAVAFPPVPLANLCRKHHVRRLSIYGSALRGDFAAESDLDVLVEFEAGHVPGLLVLGGIANRLSEMVGGRPVDLKTPMFLGADFRDRVLREAVVQYECGD